MNIHEFRCIEFNYLLTNFKISLHLLKCNFFNHHLFYIIHKSHKEDKKIKNLFLDVKI